MKHRHGLIRAVLLALLVQAAACGPALTPQSEPAPGPVQTPGGSPASTTTALFTLVVAPPDPEAGTDRPQKQNTVLEVLSSQTAPTGGLLAYHAYVVTALESGVMRIQSEVLKAGPNAYPYGYGYPLDTGTLNEDFSLTFWASHYVQDALTTGTAIYEHQMVKGHQYVLLYKTFPSFMPLTYRLTLPPTLKAEGRIQMLWPQVTVPADSTGLITLENPRPDVLNRLMAELNARN